MDKPTVAISPTDKIYEGGEIKLTCNVDANPQVTFSWRQQDSTIVNEKNQNLRKRLFKTTSYRCIATQSEYTEESDKITVKIKGEKQPCHN